MLLSRSKTLERFHSSEFDNVTCESETLSISVFKSDSVVLVMPEDDTWFNTFAAVLLSMASSGF